MFRFKKPPSFRFAPLKVAFHDRREYGLKYRDLFVFWHLWDRANYKTNTIRKVSQVKLAKRMQIQRSCLNQSLDRLEKAGFVERFPGTTGRTTEYRITYPYIEVCPENATQVSPQNVDNAGLPSADKSSPDFADPFQSISQTSFTEERYLFL